jgi:hypothetical protein
MRQAIHEKKLTQARAGQATARNEVLKKEKSIKHKEKGLENKVFLALLSSTHLVADVFLLET